MRPFFEHYRALGVPAESIHVILNTTDAASPALAEAQRFLQDAGAAAPHLWVAPYTSETMWAERRRVQRAVCSPGDWVLNADVDELQRYPDTLGAVASFCELTGRNVVQGFLIDRLAEGGRLNAYTEGDDLADAYPVRAEVALSLIGRGENHGIGATVKMMMHRGDVFPKRGGHNPKFERSALRYLAGAPLSHLPQAANPVSRFRFPFQVDHYKWRDTRRQSYERRIDTPGVSAAGKEVGGKFLDYLGEHGALRLDDISVAAPSDQPAGNWRAQMLRLMTKNALQKWVASGSGKLARGQS
ncbi:hypothetical protein HK107_10995 [Parvularcula sp. ZS-1/3]|uniref:Glycosyl transferase family 2 n=1 Tax=Parvularcula mediterranea TaxID=2732508 RepID=A0A7Y3RMK4_9PROT|nr:hypothetical protein [Parvularcula mediterranea]NNU16844.1 hypothetical protein [Parvularcula mediterranea]